MIRFASRTRWIGCVACFGAAFLGDAAPAATLTLGTSSPTGSPIEFFAGGESDPIDLLVVAEAAPSSPEDFLTGWQVALGIVPQPGATGAVTFATPAGPGALEPPNYVLDGANFGISVTNSGDELLAFDFNFPASGGVEVPTSPGVLLLVLGLESSPDALGTFDLVALSGPGLTEWTDSASPVQQVRSFANLPTGVGMGVIGRVQVRVPEPAAFLLVVVSHSVLATRRGHRGRATQAVSSHGA